MLVLPPDTTTLSQAFVEFAKRQLLNATLHADPELRDENRSPMVLPATIVGIDEDFQPIGEPFEILTRDMSSDAIGLFAEKPIDVERLAIRMDVAGTEVILALQVLWAAPMGPFYGCGCRFIEKLGTFPAGI